jgi:hypothetical protein
MFSTHLEAVRPYSTGRSKSTIQQKTIKPKLRVEHCAHEMYSAYVASINRLMLLVEGKVVPLLKHLGTTLTNQNDIHDEIKSR